MSTKNSYSSIAVRSPVIERAVSWNDPPDPGTTRNVTSGPDSPGSPGAISRIGMESLTRRDREIGGIVAAPEVRVVVLGELDPHAVALGEAPAVAVKIELDRLGVARQRVRASIDQHLTAVREDVVQACVQLHPGSRAA